MSHLIAQVSDALGAQRGFVVLRQDGDWRVMAHHPSLQQSSAAPSFSRTIVQQVAESGCAAVTLDAVNEGRFCAPSITIQGLRSIVCAPLRWGGQVQGVVYADHNVKAGVFKTEHLEVLSAIADQASRSLETAALQEQLQRVHQLSLEKARRLGVADQESRAGEAALEFAVSSLEDGPVCFPWQASDVAPTQGVVLSLFGPFRAAVDGRSVCEWSTRKNRDLLAYLAAHSGQVVSEEKLMDLFWSQGGKKGLHSLHNGITQIRKTLGCRDAVVRKLDGYSLGPDCWVDVEEFVSTYTAGRRLVRQGKWEEALPIFRQAEALAGGPFLQDNEAEWVAPLRQTLTEPLTECRALLAEHFSQRGKHVVAIELWKRVLSLDNCSEEAYRGLIEAYSALGRQADAVRAYQACVRAFQEELDLPPPSDLADFLDI